MSKPEISDLFTLAGVGLVIGAVSALAGGWWAMLAGGCVLVTMGYALHTNGGPK